MPIIQMPRGVSPVQVEFVGKDAEKIERSVKGALHLNPGSTKVVTEDELLYIEKNEKELASKLHVVPGTRAKKPSGKVLVPSTKAPANNEVNREGDGKSKSSKAKNR